MVQKNFFFLLIFPIFLSPGYFFGHLLYHLIVGFRLINFHQFIFSKFGFLLGIIIINYICIYSHLLYVIGLYRDPPIYFIIFRFHGSSLLIFVPFIILNFVFFDHYLSLKIIIHQFSSFYSLILITFT